VVLADEEIVEAVYEALAKRHPKSRCRGRQATPADVVLRLLILKHIRNWSYEVLEREVRANLVYRDFTHVGWRQDAGCQDDVPLGFGARARGAQTSSRTDGQNSPRQRRDHRATHARGHDGG